MNKIKLKNPGYLAPLFLALGLVGMFLYKWLFAYVEDPVSGLLPAFTPQWTPAAVNPLAAHTPPEI